MTLMQTAETPTREQMVLAQAEGGAEYVGGQIVEKPVSTISSYVTSRINAFLQTEASKAGDAWVFDSSMGYQCFPEESARFRKPDVSVIRTQRMKGLPGEVGLLPIPADLAVEVNSPNDLASNVEEKVDEYLRAGFACVWVVDPPTKSVTIHRLDGSVTRLRQNQEITGESAIPTFKCLVAEFFKMPL